MHPQRVHGVIATSAVGQGGGFVFAFEPALAPQMPTHPVRDAGAVCAGVALHPPTRDRATACGAVRNGLALTCTAHWLFDRALISADDWFRILLASAALQEGVTMLLSPDRRLRLPASKKHQAHTTFLAFIGRIGSRDEPPDIRSDLIRSGRTLIVGAHWAHWA